MSTIRTYRAPTVREAIALIRAELGGDALVLGQREIRKRRWPWRRATVETEVTAAVPVETRRFDTAGTSAAARHRTRADGDSTRLSVPAVSRLQLGARTEVCEHADPFRLYTQLIDCDVDESVARQILTESQAGPAEAALLVDRCRDSIRRSVTCSGPIRITPGRRRIAALVGPTGVGKTTTIAKLAANFRLRDRIRVGLITVDTYRVAAVEQLRTYAELIGIPMQVVTGPREMPTALDELTDVDLVLIDTAGRGPGEDLRIQELRTFLQSAQADEVHLVTSLTAGLSNLSLTIERFGRVSPTALLLTKLDEAAGPGAVVSATRLAGLPLSYITTGQDVPDDIETADAERIAQRVLPVGSAGDVVTHPEWALPARSGPGTSFPPGEVESLQLQDAVAGERSRLT